MAQQEALHEAQSLAFAPELLDYCSAQRTFVDSGIGLEILTLRSAALARAAHIRLLQPEVLLRAMHLGGCYRTNDVCWNVSSVECHRYTESLNVLMDAYFGSDSRPADRGLGERG